MKLNTTPTIPVRIPVSFEDVSRVELIFKKENSKKYPALLHKVFNKEDITIEQGTTDGYFILQVPFTAEETMSLPAGEVYMDTLLVLEGEVIPETNIITLNVRETLFEEVYQGGRNNVEGAGST